MTERFLGLLIPIAALCSWTCGGAGSSGAGTPGGPTGAGGTPLDGASVTGLPLTDCGYPMMGATGLAAVVFNESNIIESIVAAGGGPMGTIQVFYSDDHAMPLGVREVDVKEANGTMTVASFPVSALPSDPSMVTNPMVGTTMLAGDDSGLDGSLRPMWPALFITDTTTNPNSRAGDWQQGGVPVLPSAVFGSWKGAVRVVDKTMNPPTASVTPDPDPNLNHWNLASGDPVPRGLPDQGFGTEVRFEVPLQASHSYRVQFMVHDGDQLKVGGDSGEGCVLYSAGGSSSDGGGTGGSAPPPMCPAGSIACGGDPTPCPGGDVCVSGCCLPSVVVP
jgi:hypothetical protein